MVDDGYGAGVPLPQALRRFNRRVTNPFLGTLFGRVPPFGIVRHVGRRSGRPYRTPVWAFPVGDGRWVFALLYGSDVDWLANVLAAGQFEMERRGRVLRLGSLELVRDTAVAAELPAPIRWALRFFDTDEFLLATATS